MSVVKRLVYLFLLPALAVCTVSKGQNKEGVDEDFHLYLLVGQSNMAGRGHLDSISEIEDPRIKTLNKENEWLIAKDPIHFDKKNAGVGPGISFAEAMLGYSKKKEITIGLIPCAVGGTAIDKWERGGYDQETDTHTDAGITFNKMLKELPGQVKYTKVVKADGVTTIEDGIHFDSPSQRIMGKRYAAAMNSLLLQE